jgi:ADP-heptose:LPS heptosyltransferase
MPPDPANFYSTTRAARKIIVVDLGFLGDTVHLVPALWEIKLNYPAARLEVLTTPVGAEVLALAPCVDRAWALDMHPKTRTLKQQWQILRGLWHERFDVAYNFSGADRTIFMTALTLARWRVAHPGGRQHFWNSWLIPYWIPRQDRDLIVFEQRRRMLAECGVPLGKARFDLKVGDTDQAWAAQIVPSPAIHLSLNASKPTREWPLEHHAQMLRSVWGKYPQLTVIATAGAMERERTRVNQLAELLKDKRFCPLMEPLTIARLCAILKRCRLHIGPDSGVIHLAMALDVPTISFFREQGAYKSFAPCGPKHRVLSRPCRCIDHRDAPCEATGRAECIATIQPQQVADLVIQSLRP